MKTLYKYLLLAFLIENIMTQTYLMSFMSEYLFYPFLVLGILAFVNPELWRSKNLSRFSPLYILMALYILYEFTIGSAYIDNKTLLYLVAKVATFGIIISGITYGEEFYKTKAVILLVSFMAFFLCYGIITGENVVMGGTGRIRVGYTNENTTGTMGALTAGMLLFYMRNRKWNAFYAILLIIGCYGIFAGASRAGFLMLFLMVILRFGLNLKTVLFILLVGGVGIFLLPSIGLDTVGMQRMINTYNGVEGSNREPERLAAEWMISQRPFIGWGFENVNQGYALFLSKLGPHNGYLEIAKQMGIPFAILYFLTIAVTLIRCWLAKNKHHEYMNVYLALALMLLVKANYESLFVGVHEYGTNVFFTALCMSSAHLYYLKHKKIGQ